MRRRTSRFLARPSRAGQSRPLAIGDLVWFRQDFQTIGLVVEVDAQGPWVRWPKGGRSHRLAPELLFRLDELIDRHGGQIGRLLAEREQAEQALGPGSLIPFRPYVPFGLSKAHPSGMASGDPVVRWQDHRPRVVGVLIDDPQPRPLTPFEVRVRWPDGEQACARSGLICFDGLISAQIQAQAGHVRRRDVAQRRFRTRAPLAS